MGKAFLFQLSKEPGYDISLLKDLFNENNIELDILKREGNVYLSLTIQKSKNERNAGRKKKQSSLTVTYGDIKKQLEGKKKGKKVEDVMIELGYSRATMFRRLKYFKDLEEQGEFVDDRIF